MIRPLESASLRFSHAQSAPIAARKTPPPQSVRFEGLHQDSVVSVRVPLVHPTHNKAFEGLMEDYRHMPFGHRELHLKRTPHNGSEITVSLDRSGRQKVGYLPERLAQIVAPLLDKGDTRFYVALNAVAKGKEAPEPVLRLDMLTNPGRSPNVSRTAAFHRALADAEIPHSLEKMQKVRVAGDTLVRTVNEEQSLENWYLNGHLVQRVDLRSSSFQPATHLRKRSLPTAVAELIQRNSFSAAIKSLLNPYSFKSDVGPSQENELPRLEPLFKIIKAGD